MYLIKFSIFSFLLFVTSSAIANPYIEGTLEYTNSNYFYNYHTHKTCVCKECTYSVTVDEVKGVLGTITIGYNLDKYLSVFAKHQSLVLEDDGNGMNSYGLRLRVDF